MHAMPHGLDDADIFVADDYGHRDGLLRPGVPVVDVNVGPANGRLLDVNEDVIVADFRHRDFLEPKAGLGLLLDERLHRFLHGRKIVHQRPGRKL